MSHLLPAHKLDAIDLCIRMINERNRHPLVPAELSTLRAAVKAEQERDRVFGTALIRSGFLDDVIDTVGPELLGALVRLAVEATGHVIAEAGKADTK